MQGVTITMQSRYYDLISKILPINCESYLVNKGWRETGKINGVAKFFCKKNDAGILSEVLVPTNVSFKDFNSVVFNLLIELQDFESRPLEYIANDIILSKYDVFRIVAFKGDTTASLPLEDASTLITKSLSMMASVAQSINNQSSYFQSRRSNEVNDFLRKLRMGHTERGSFIVTIQTPIVPDMRLPGIVEPEISEEPFERQVTTRLCSLISKATDIAIESDAEALSKSVVSGLSANFFEALADITDVCGDKGVNMDMTWASIRPIQQRWNIPTNFNIKKELVDNFRFAGQILRQTMPEKAIEIAGYVTTLHRTAGENVGHIKLHDITSDPTRIVSIDLPIDKYEMALKAHKSTQILIVKGDLTKNNRNPSLTNISEFNVVSANDFALPHNKDN